MGQVGVGATAGAWGDAVSRAGAATHRTRPGGLREDSWDDVAIRDILAMALYALHLREGLPVDEVPWESALWHLRDDRRLIALVEAELPRAGHHLVPVNDAGGSTDPVTLRWIWLNRTWDPTAPSSPFNGPSSSPNDLPCTPAEPSPGPRWDGMTRGIGRGLPDPAVEICTHWAAGVIEDTLAADGRALDTHQRVRVTSGPLADQSGYVRQTSWTFDDDARIVTGPAGYVVDLDDTEDMRHIARHALTPGADLRWPARTPGSLKDRPSPSLDLASRPGPSCAQDLAEILGRASNPEVVPEALRERIASASGHHHLELDHQASPRPDRRTWRVLMHWYQHTDSVRYDPRSALWEVQIRTHLNDEPTHHLALTEEDAERMTLGHIG
jgi:hypothetical protein